MWAFFEIQIISLKRILNETMLLVFVVKIPQTETLKSLTFKILYLFMDSLTDENTRNLDSLLSV